MIEKVCKLLPEYISASILVLPKDFTDKICEIRLRKNSVISLTTYNRNLFLDTRGKLTRDISSALVSGEKDIVHVINRLCEGSLYRYMPNIRLGYIVTRDGIRAGISGECIYNGREISTVTAFSGINLRIPHDIEKSGDVISKFLAGHPHDSLLLTSPAGYGKTTVIRSVAKAMGTGRFGPARRVALIDERGEILPGGPLGLIDLFSGYRKSDGIEIATRLFSPEVIVCDEIGYSDDVESLLSVQNSGIPLIATTHAESLKMALKRPDIKRLVDSGVFTAYARIEKGEDGSRVVFEEREE